MPFLRSFKLNLIQENVGGIKETQAEINAKVNKMKVRKDYCDCVQAQTANIISRLFTFETARLALETSSAIEVQTRLLFWA